MKEMQVVEGPLELTWSTFREECARLSARVGAHIEKWERAVGVKHRKENGPLYVGVYGVPTGGSFVAMELSSSLSLPLLDAPVPGCLVVDDVVATGRTINPYLRDYPCEALYTKSMTADGVALLSGDGAKFPGATLVQGWIKFPWEHSAAPEDAVVRLLEYMNIHPHHEGVRETPRRYLEALREMTSGYYDKPEEILSKTFPESYNEMVVVSDVKFWSLCEHHLLPFSGTATVGYLPGKEKGKVVGLSKLTRTIQAFARRLQVQERMTKQIVEAIQKALQPDGVGCVLRAAHSCMEMRGARSSGLTTTSYLVGLFRSDEKVRSEFMALALARG